MSQLCHVVYGKNTPPLHNIKSATRIKEEIRTSRDDKEGAEGRKNEERVKRGERRWEGREAG